MMPDLFYCDHCGVLEPEQVMRVSERIDPRVIAEEHTDYCECGLEVERADKALMWSLLDEIIRLAGKGNDYKKCKQHFEELHERFYE